MKINNPSEHFTKNEISSIEKALRVANDDVSFLETLMQIIPSPIFYKNSTGVYKFCNIAFCDYLGLPKSAIIEHTVYDIAPINLANDYQQADLDLIQSQGTQNYESQVRYADGSLRDVIFHKTAHVDDKGESIGLVGVMIDITSQKNTERQIQRQNIIKDVLIHISHVINQNTNDFSFYELLLGDLIDAIPSVDYGTILEIDDEDFFNVIANSGYEQEATANFKIPLRTSYMFANSEGQLETPNRIDDLSIYFSDNYPAQLETVDGRRIRSCLYIPIRLNDGQRIIISLESATLSAFSDLDINIAEYIQLQIPILHQIYALNRKTLQLSRYDTLTGLMNRGYFNTIFEDRLNLARRDQSKLSLIMFDLDGLKIINDNFGHAAGDRYLEHFSTFIENQFRSTDTFARIGGDEFLGIFSTTDPITLKKKMTLLQTLYTELPIESEEILFYGRFSYGIATFPDDADTVDGLLTISDIKMYRDKKNDPSS